MLLAAFVFVAVGWAAHSYLSSRVPRPTDPDAPSYHPQYGHRPPGTNMDRDRAHETFYNHIRESWNQ